jgi:hypothetical protein
VETFRYPKWIYHASEPARIVADEVEHAAAGPEWAESPGEALKVFSILPTTLEPFEAVPDSDLPVPARKRGRPRKDANA